LYFFPFIFLTKKINVYINNCRASVQAPDQARGHNRRDEKDDSEEAVWQLKNSRIKLRALLPLRKHKPRSSGNTCNMAGNEETPHIGKNE
jgi:hypothetical protein